MRWGRQSAYEASRRVLPSWDGTGRVMQAPLPVVDYVLAHELTHLLHDDHGRDFWAASGRVLPDYEDRKKRLRELGPTLAW
jgi:predicted metal-dependent hydrolase